MLACFPPLDILAEMEAQVCTLIRNIPLRGGKKPEEELDSIKRQERQEALVKWCTQLSEERLTHKRVVETFLPIF